MSYLGDVGYEADEFLSVLTGGARGQTISLRAALAARAAIARGHPWAPSCLLCRWLSLTVETAHCAKQLAGVATRPAAALRAGMQIALACGLVDLLLHLVF